MSCLVENDLNFVSGQFLREMKEFEIYRFRAVILAIFHFHPCTLCIGMRSVCMIKRDILSSFSSLQILCHTLYPQIRSENMSISHKSGSTPITADDDEKGPTPTDQQQGPYRIAKRPFYDLSDNEDDENGSIEVADPLTSFKGLEITESPHGSLGDSVAFEFCPFSLENKPRSHDHGT